MSKRKRLSKSDRQALLDDMTLPLDEWAWENMSHKYPRHADRIQKAVDGGVEDDWLKSHFEARGYSDGMCLWYEQCVRYLVAERDKEKGE